MKGGQPGLLGQNSSCPPAFGSPLQPSTALCQGLVMPWSSCVRMKNVGCLGSSLPSLPAVGLFCSAQGLFTIACCGMPMGSGGGMLFLDTCRVAAG